MIVAPSLLSANFLNLEADINMINESEADWFHIDVMDGLFVPNISFGQSITKQIKSLAKKPLDVHLMIVDPDRYVESFKDAGADLLSVHCEACTHLHRSLHHIKQHGMKAGAVLNPHTPVSMLENVIDSCDYVLLMSVNPGFGGQKFIEGSYRKIVQLAELKAKYNPDLIIEIDGGVTLENAPLLKKAGVDAVVAGNTVFGSKDPLEAIRLLKV